MARTIKEIANGMKASFVQNSKLMEAYGLEYTGERDDDALAFYAANISTVSVESVLINIVAACVAVVENLMDFHKKEIDTAIARERYGHAGWYEKMALKFRYGETDFGLDESTGQYSIESDKIIKHASCEDMGFGVKLKVTKDEDEPSPLDDEEKSAFAAYINRLKPAGVPVTIVSKHADLLKLKMYVYYDPTVYSEGNATEAVKQSIKSYLHDIDFNGVFVTMAMVDRLQKVAGLDIIEVDAVYAKRAGYDYEQIENNAQYRPEAGYMTLAGDEDLELKMINLSFI